MYFPRETSRDAQITGVLSITPQSVHIGRIYGTQCGEGAKQVPGGQKGQTAVNTVPQVCELLRE